MITLWNIPTWSILQVHGDPRLRASDQRMEYEDRNWGLWMVIEFSAVRQSFLAWVCNVDDALIRAIQPLFIQKHWRETLADSVKERQSYSNSVSLLLNDSSFNAASYPNLDSFFWFLGPSYMFMDSCRPHVRNLGLWWQPKPVIGPARSAFPVWPGNLTLNQNMAALMLLRIFFFCPAS